MAILVWIDLALTLQELEAHVEHLKKNHRHEVGIERARQKDVQRELIELQQQCERKELQLKVYCLVPRITRKILFVSCSGLAVTPK